MTFVDRKYPDLVRDVLTNLTQGVAGELHRVSYDPNAHLIQIPDVVLSRRLVAGAAPDDPPVPYTFGLNDYELVPDANDTDSLSTIRFLPFGRKPAPDTDLRVNYYPRTTAPAVRLASSTCEVPRMCITRSPAARR